jgi:hypothetical protein
MKGDATILLLPDAGPLITLAYAGALDVLFMPGWSVQIVDMVLHEVTHNQTPTSQAVAAWVNANKLHILPTKTLKHFQHVMAAGAVAQRKSNLGELAIQEAMNDFALIEPPPTGVFLFEDHKIVTGDLIVPEIWRTESAFSSLFSLSFCSVFSS